MKTSSAIKIAISTVAAALIILHVVKPLWKIDAVTLGFIVVAVLPWFYSVVESAKFPGGWEIKFRDVKSAERKIAGHLEDLHANASDDTPREMSYFAVEQEDPNLALVSLRIELERTLRALAGHNSLQIFGYSTKAVLSELINHGLILPSMGKGIDELLSLGDRAAHGAKVDDSVAKWASTSGNAILSSLNSLL